MASFVACGIPAVCKCFAGFLICTGINIKFFPVFEQSIRYKTVHIEISDTSLRKVPNIEPLHWPMLHSIDFRGTNISCKDIYDFMMKHKSLTLYYECKDQNGTETDHLDYTTPFSTNEWRTMSVEVNKTQSIEIWKPYMITTIFELSLSLIIITVYTVYRILRIRKKRHRQRNRDLPLLCDLVHTGETSDLPRISTI